MLKSNQRAILDLLSHHVANKPDSRVLGGKSFMLGGNAELTKRGDGIYSGDLSGISANKIPWWARERYFPPHDLASIGDWDVKIEKLAPLSLSEDIRTLGGTVSWMLAFIEQTITLRPGAERVVDIYPNLNLLVHGGVNFAPYRRRLR